MFGDALEIAIVYQDIKVRQIPKLNARIEQGSNKLFVMLNSIEQLE